MYYKKGVCKMAGAPKTMRFAEDVERYINAQKGENFSEKFHNLVRKFKDEETEKERRIGALIRQIEDKEARLKALDEVLFNVGHLERQFKGLQQSIDGCRGYLENFMKRDVEKVLNPKKLEKLRNTITCR
jgi:type I site-specific restriction endonuclease